MLCVKFKSIKHFYFYLRSNIQNYPQNHLAVWSTYYFLKSKPGHVSADIMAGFVHRQVGMRKTGITASIPNNAKARCMYYLKTVSGLLDLDNPNVHRLTNYERYWSLSDEETKTLLVLVLVLSPDELVNKVMFQSDEMCGDSSNEFYEISQVRTRLLS